MTKDLTNADCYIGTGTDFIIIMKDTKTSRVSSMESMQEEKILSSKIVGLVVVRSLVLQAGIFNFRIFGKMRYYKFTKCHIQTIYSTKDGQVSS